MLKSLKLTNFKKHKNLEVDFTQGLNVIKGPNFCGKSTVLKAVAVALYGITGAGTKSRICTTGQSKWKIELAIEVAGKDYTVVRSGSASKVLYKDEVVANGNSVVTSWVADNTGSDLDDFLTHTYSKQMETSTLLTMGSAKLQNKVEKLANVEVVDKVLKLIREKTSEAKGKLELLSEQDLVAVTEEYETAKAKRILSNTEHDSALNFLQELNSSTETMEADYQSRTDTLMTIQLKESLLEQYNDSISTAEKSIADKTLEIRKISGDTEANYEKISDELNFMESTLLHKVDAVALKESYESKIATAELWITTKGEPLLKEELRLNPLIDAMEVENIEYREFVSEKLADKNKSKIQLNNLISVRENSTCPTCLRTNEGVDLDKIEQQIKQKEISHKAVCEVHAEAQEELEILQKELESALEEYPGEGHAELIAQQKGVIADLTAKVSGMDEVPSRGELETMRSELDPKRAEQSALRGLIDLFNRLSSEIEDNRRSIKEDNALVSEILPEIASLKLQKHDPQSLVEKMNLQSSKRISQQEEVERLSEVLQEVNIEFAVAESQYKSAKESDKKVKELNKSLGLFNKLSKYLRDSRSRFLSTVWDGILARATEIVSGATAGNEDQITQIGRDKKGAFFYVEKGEEFGMMDASGCQLEMMGVALRLSLCDLFYGHGSYMMLDEASSQMNEENAAALAGVLAATGKQIIYVTHREAEETSAKNVITLGER